MSRDWTPRETYLMDKNYYKQNGLHFYEIPFVTIVGENVVNKRPTKEDIELGKKYPNLICTGIDGLYKMVKVVPEEILLEVDDYVKELCEQDTFESKHHYPNTLENETINKWYNGELNSNFYYRERNDNYLVEYLSTVKEVEEIRKSNEIEKERD